MLLLIIFIGLIAQLIDGTIGLGYGVISGSCLLSIGLMPASASAAVHTAEIFTTFASGISHLKFGNVDKALVRKILIPGVIFGAIGAFAISYFSGEEWKPFVSLYLMIVGIGILWKALSKKRLFMQRVPIPILGAVGGFFDAVGCGGWGPICTSTLVLDGHNPRFSIGSVNFSEFFITSTQVIVFFTILGLKNLEVILALIVGGIVAAPIAAYTCRKIPAKKLMLLVGATIILLSLKNLV
jgi:uncharacterized membrane protein YfcA